MPLEHGIESLNWSHKIPRESAALIHMFDKREAILSFYSMKPALLQTPYRMHLIDGEKKHSVPRFIKYSCCHNSIYAMLCEIGCGPELIDLNSHVQDWEQIHWYEDLNSDDESIGYQLIDISLYLVFVLNLYIPNKALISNLFSANVVIDAIGRENRYSAVRSISKVVYRALDWQKDNCNIDAVEIIVNDIIMLMEHEKSEIDIKSVNIGIEFERKCENLLRSGGFEVQTTPKSGDYGADIVAFQDGLGYVVQCKDTIKPAGIKAVQEAVAARKHYAADYAVVCCSGGFTDAAVELATSNKVILSSADQLVRRMDLI